MKLNAFVRPVIAISCLVLCFSVRSGSSDRAHTQSAQITDTIPDLSGLAWVEGDDFLAIHDSKMPDETGRVRISMLRLPKSLGGITLTPLTVHWPLPLGPSSDLESVARIPGTNSYLLVESGLRVVGQPRYRRVFLVEVKNLQAVLLSFTELPDFITNIEGSAVARVGSRLIVLFGERGDHRPSSEVYWTELQLRPLKFGSFNKEYFSPVGFTGRNKRPVSAIDVDQMGQVYIASAMDPNDDGGPFSSVIWRAGRLHSDRNNGIRLGFSAKPHRLATLDGLKVESVAIREIKEGSVEIFAGTDDEYYGGAVRPIPIEN
jgi:hypothetical protein